MSGAFSAGRVVRRLRQQTEEVVRAVRRMAACGVAPWVLGGSGDVDSGLDKRQVNAQIPVKPVYIAPRNPVVLCHGLYGFDVKGPEKVPMLQVHYWRGIREALEGVGAQVLVAKVSGTGGVHERAHQLNTLLTQRAANKQVNLIGHSMGGLDARYLLAHIRPHEYSVTSLTTVCTPHRGSPFMDWCRDYLSLGYRVDREQLVRDFVAARGLDGEEGERVGRAIERAVHGEGKGGQGDRRVREFAQYLTQVLGERATSREERQLERLTQRSVSSGDQAVRTRGLLRMVYRRLMATVDTPAYACLTRDYCERFFNPSTPNMPGVTYLSVGAYMDPRQPGDRVNPLKIPNEIISRTEGPNDGFVSVRSAQWGEYLGSVCADHFDFTNRWRVSALGRDVVAALAGWTAWGGSAQEGGRDVLGEKMFAGGRGAGGRFDPVDFYLRMGTVLYQRGF